jgi:hypothetical protein
MAARAAEALRSSVAFNLLPIQKAAALWPQPAQEPQTNLWQEESMPVKMLVTVVVQRGYRCLSASC